MKRSSRGLKWGEKERVETSVFQKHLWNADCVTGAMIRPWVLLCLPDSRTSVLPIILWHLDKSSLSSSILKRYMQD
jgi:monomeric isocitrate dehydrogenase